MKKIALTLMIAALAGCSQTPGGSESPAAPSSTTGADAAEQTRPRTRTEGARTADSLDTTSEAERAQAATPPEGGALLGETVASLGNVGREGFWLETPLVDETVPGRIEYAATGETARVELRPIPGPDTAGSRISLAAMRLIGAPLTGLPTLQVYLAD
ncbi:hypothetical protein [Allosediminivita pacifica]|uniref:D-galactarate dehydratase n=1 Tax=Allosediminivita pacifica TaxID=1267769 RepID=A0A2T6AT11_9RHOB|nr:hypothetical protein [Allosediminivita pacifica]PTX46955.1 hypothetical protein C8N44_11497 [Allosediminivita pacifica]GGB14931.1 hypothetical protein GCM10011324_26390 [Allosediminivita pacifica]